MATSFAKLRATVSARPTNNKPNSFFHNSHNWAAAIGGPFLIKAKNIMHNNWTPAQLEKLKANVENAGKTANPAATYKNGVKIQGFNLTTANGTTDYTLQVAGSSEVLLGFFTLEGNLNQVLNISVNNFMRVKDAPLLGFDSGNIEGSYFPLTAPFSNRQNIQLSITDTAARNVFIVFYYA